jgi:hypothetical protein
MQGPLRFRSVGDPHFWQNRPEVGQHFQLLGSGGFRHLGHGFVHAALHFIDG